jgi:hypothetical protein
MKRLKHLTRWLLIVHGVALVAAMWLALIAGTHRWSPHERAVNCDLSEISPDITTKERQACRQLRSTKL